MKKDSIPPPTPIMSVPLLGFESSADHAIKHDGIIILLGFLFMIISVALLARYDNDDDW
jgi:hypothetical protein